MLLLKSVVTNMMEWFECLIKYLVTVRKVIIVIRMYKIGFVSEKLVMPWLYSSISYLLLFALQSAFMTKKP